MKAKKATQQEKEYMKAYMRWLKGKELTLPTINDFRRTRKAEMELRPQETSLEYMDRMMELPSPNDFK